MFASAFFSLCQHVSWCRVSLLAALGLYLSACSTLTPTSTLPEPVIKPPTVALVLGGGGARGFAHVGVIKALEDNGITPNVVVGTSVGSLVGSLYASGYTPSQLERLALTTTDDELMDFTLSNQGFIEGNKLKNFINTKVNGRPIESFPIHFAAIAAEKHTLKKAVFNTGNAGLAVQASCSVPNIFIAPRIPEKVGKKYIDGGVISLVPVDSARDLGADIIIAVDLTAPSAHPPSGIRRPLSALSTFSGFWGLLESNMAASNSQHISAMRHERDRADIVITPNISHISSINTNVDTRQRQALITAGVQAATAQMTTIKQQIKDKSAKQ